MVNLCSQKQDCWYECKEQLNIKKKTSSRKQYQKFYIHKHKLRLLETTSQYCVNRKCLICYLLIRNIYKNNISNESWCGVCLKCDEIVCNKCMACAQESVVKTRKQK